MTALADARSHLAKAREFLEAARSSHEQDMFNAAASNAVIAGINAKDAICLRLTGVTAVPHPRCLGTARAPRQDRADSSSMLT